MKIVFYVSQIGWCFCKMGFKIIDIHMDVNSMLAHKVDPYDRYKWDYGAPISIAL